jgi:hypothetical protein
MLTIVFLAPDLIWDHVSHSLHILYESFSFFQEEILIHVLDFTKHRAQMLVFSLLLRLGLAVIRCLWRCLPKIISVGRVKALLIGLSLKDYTQETWITLFFLQKARFLLVTLVGLPLGIGRLLS